MSGRRKLKVETTNTPFYTVRMSLPPLSQQRIDFCIEKYIANNPFTQVKGTIEECLTQFSDEEEVIVSFSLIYLYYRRWWRKNDDKLFHSTPPIKRLSRQEFQEALETALRYYKVGDNYIIKGRRRPPLPEASLSECSQLPSFL